MRRAAIAFLLAPAIALAQQAPIEEVPPEVVEEPAEEAAPVVEAAPVEERAPEYTWPVQRAAPPPPVRAEPPPYTPPAVGMHVLTPREREMIFGLWRIEYGIIDYLSIGTNTPYWIAGLPFATTFPNLFLRGSIPVHENFTLGARLGLTYFDLGQVFVSASGNTESQLDSKLIVLPLAIGGTFHLDWFTGTLELVYTFVGGNAAAPLSDDTGLGAFAYVDTLQLYLNLEARVSPEVAFTGQLRYLPYHGPIVVGVETDTMMGQTIVRGEVETSISSLANSAAVLAGIFLTFAPFNLRFSLGWGRFFFPDVGLVVPIDFVQADLDLYFRFQL